MFKGREDWEEHSVSKELLEHSGTFPGAETEENVTSGKQHLTCSKVHSCHHLSQLPTAAQRVGNYQQPCGTDGDTEVSLDTL